MRVVDYLVWCARYGDDYHSEAERRAGYADYRANHADLAVVFTPDETS